MTVPLVPATTAPVVGRYRLVQQPDYVAAIVYRDDRLLLINPEGEQEHIMPTTQPGVFVVVATNESIVFDIDAAGTATRAIYRTNEGWNAELERVEDID